MATKGIKRELKKALRRANAEINNNARSGSMYARGLAAEGYAGGYAAALRDVLLALEGSQPSHRFWGDRRQ